MTNSTDKNARLQTELALTKRECVMLILGLQQLQAKGFYIVGCRVSDEEIATATRKLEAMEDL